MSNSSEDKAGISTLTLAQFLFIRAQPNGGDNGTTLETRLAAFTEKYGHTYIGIPFEDGVWCKSWAHYCKVAGIKNEHEDKPRLGWYCYWRPRIPGGQVSERLAGSRMGVSIGGKVQEVDEGDSASMAGVYQRQDEVFITLYERDLAEGFVND